MNQLIYIYQGPWMNKVLLHHQAYYVKIFEPTPISLAIRLDLQSTLNIWPKITTKGRVYIWYAICKVCSLVMSLQGAAWYSWAISRAPRYVPKRTCLKHRSLVDAEPCVFTSFHVVPLLSLHRMPLLSLHCAPTLSLPVDKMRLNATVTG